MTSKQWKLGLIGFVILAIGVSVTIGIVVSEVDRINSTQKSIKALQEKNVAIQRSIATGVVHTSGAICEIALGSEQDEQRVVNEFLQGDFTIDQIFTPKCQRVANRAVQDIFVQNGKAIPPALKP